MKRFYGIIIAFIALLGFQSALHSQTAPCPSVIAETYALDPQGGNYNSFGVRVTLNQTYPTNVVVSGYVYDDGSPNTNTPYTLTILAGYLTNETGAGFYVTAPATNGVCNISSQTTLSCYVNPFDYIGEQHNAVLDYAYVNFEVPATSEDDIFDIVQAYFTTIDVDTVRAFFDSTKGTIHEFQSVTDICSTFLAKGMSSGFNDYYNSIDALLDGASTPDDFYLSMRSLEEEISGSGLSSNEKSTLLATAAVYRYSAYYWSTSGRIEDWVTKSGLTAFQKLVKSPDNIKESGPYSTFDMNILQNKHYCCSWRGVAKADGHGAIQGGVAGVAGGVGGMVGGALLWGAGCSVDNILTQVWHWLF